MGGLGKIGHTAVTLHKVLSFTPWCPLLKTVLLEPVLNKGFEKASYQFRKSVWSPIRFDYIFIIKDSLSDLERMLYQIIIFFVMI